MTRSGYHTLVTIMRMGLLMVALGVVAAFALCFWAMSLLYLFTD